MNASSGVPNEMLAAMTDASAEPIAYKRTTDFKLNDQAITGLVDIYYRWNDEPQTFTINPKTETAVHAKEGTEFRFPPDIFVYPDGRTPKDEITITVKEFYSDADFIKANLTTTSNGSLIESAGTVYVEAWSDGKKLELRPAKSFRVMFPRDDRYNMQIFYGTRDKQGLVNWKVEDQIESREEDVDETSWEDGDGEWSSLFGENSFMYVDEDTGEEIIVTTSDNGAYSPLVKAGECFISLNESKLLSGWKYNTKGYAWKLDENNQTLSNYFLSTFNPSEKMIDDFCILGLESQVIFSLDKKGSIRDWYFGKKSTPEYDSLITQFVRGIPKLDLDELVGGYNTSNKCQITIGKAKVVTREEWAKQFRARNTDKENPGQPLAAIKKEDLDHYVFNSSQLGWINCDRFTTEEKLIDFVVQNDWGGDATVNLVFEDMNSILQGYNEGSRIVFKDVPADKKVKVLGIACSNSKPYMTSMNTTTSEEIFDLKGYKEFTFAQLDAELEKLN